MQNDDLRIATAAAPVREEVAKRLREAIVSGRFQPGERLREKDLVEWTNVSRTSVREALRQLETEGLVCTVPNRGPIVSILTSDDARDIYEVRALLEGFAGQQFTMHASDELIEELTASVDRMEAMVEANTLGDLRAEKERFYEILFQGCPNSLARSMFDLLYARITRLRSTTLSQEARPPLMLQELRSILEAIRARDPDRAKEAFVNHVHKAATVALQVLGSGLNRPTEP